MSDSDTCPNCDAPMEDGLCLLHEAVRDAGLDMDIDPCNDAARLRSKCRNMEQALRKIQVRATSHGDARQIACEALEADR